MIQQERGPARGKQGWFECKTKARLLGQASAIGVTTGKGSVRSFRWRDELGAGRSTVESFRKLYPTAMEDALPPRVADDPQFSFRDEANALTALTFRNGFLEELHAGEGAISDRDIRRLMVESSEALARQLRLKARDPARYRTELRAYHDR